MSGVVNGATADALRSSSRHWSFRYERVNMAGARLGDVTMRDVTIAHNNLADKAKRTLTGGVMSSASASAFRFERDLLRAYARLATPSGSIEWPLGTFMLQAATRRVGGGVDDGVPVAGFDLLQALAEDCVLARHVVLAGSNIVAAVRSLIDGAGIRQNMPTHGATMPGDREWEPGTSKLAIVNELLGSINWASLRVDPLGVVWSEPYLSPNDAPVVWRYARDALSTLRVGMTSTLDLASVPNVIVGVVSEPDRPPLTSVWRNDSPSSPLSTVSRGRTVVQMLQNDPTATAGTVDQATLDARVQQAGRTAMSVIETLDFETGIMPFHDHDTVCEIEGADGVARYREHTWSLPLRAGAAMKHSFRRTVQL